MSLESPRPQESVSKDILEIPEEKSLIPFRERIERVFEHKIPEALVVLAGSTQVTNRTDLPFRSGSYSDVDKSGAIIGNRSRIMAAAEVAKLFPEVTIVTTSVYANPPGDRPASTAEVMKNELMVKYGIPEEQIVMEETSHSTLTELVEMLKMAQKRGWKHIGVITNRYHVRRVQKMYELLDEYGPHEDAEFQGALQSKESGELEVQIVPSEAILNAKSSHFTYLEQEVIKSPEYALRVALEEQGIQDLESGNYKK